MDHSTNSKYQCRGSTEQGRCPRVKSGSAHLEDAKETRLWGWMNTSGGQGATLGKGTAAEGTEARSRAHEKREGHRTCDWWCRWACWRRRPRQVARGGQAMENSAHHCSDRNDVLSVPEWKWNMKMEYAYKMGILRARTLQRKNYNHHHLGPR